MDAVFDFAPSTDAALRKSAARDRVETWLEMQRDQLPLWLPVAFGMGAAAWFTLPSQGAWTGWLVAMAALVAAALAFPFGGRARRALLVAGIAGALGLTGAW